MQNVVLIDILLWSHFQDTIELHYKRKLLCLAQFEKNTQVIKIFDCWWFVQLALKKVPKHELFISIRNLKIVEMKMAIVNRRADNYVTVSLI